MSTITIELPSAQHELAASTKLQVDSLEFDYPTLSNRAACRQTPNMSVPIPFPTTHIKRTHSELQLAQDEVLADYQDGAMYERICKYAHFF